MAGKSPQPGAHLAAAFHGRGAPLDDAACARHLLDTLLRLFELGALVFEGERCPDSLPEGTPRSGVLGCGASGGASDDPNAYNMGSSDFIGDVE